MFVWHIFIMYSSYIANTCLSTVFCIVSSSQQQQQQQRDLNNNRYYVVDEGQNLTLPCISEHGPVMWVREGRMEEGIQVLVSYR